MAFDLGFSDQSSKATTEHVDVSGAGQYNRKSTVAQGGSVLLQKGAKIAGLDLSKASAGKGGTITVNQGVSPDLLTALVGKLTTVTTQPAPAPAGGGSP